MPLASFRDDGPAALDPPWLQDHVGGTILRSFRTVLDALGARTVEAVKLGMPGVCPPTALGYIGNDRNIERGPNQTPAGYGRQLSVAFDTWANAGGARTTLTQLRAFFAPADGQVMRIVSNRAVWHEINPSTGVVTRTAVGTNWNWDGLPYRWRDWVIIDATGLWAIDIWDAAGNWDDGGVWDSDMTEAQALALNAIAKKWKPADVLTQVIVTFDPGLFERTDTLATNPNGLGPDFFWEASQLASFYLPQGT
jgi:hypothetical protein